MGKNKLKKFADMERMDCVFQFPFAVVQQEGGCPMRGKWNELIPLCWSWAAARENMP